jgi:tRNA pseudouridine38-40 synthase
VKRGRGAGRRKAGAAKRPSRPRHQARRGKAAGSRQRRAPARHFRLTLEYDGTDFDGWQVQAGRRTVQGELETALERVTGGICDALGAGRTDAGVHAEGQVASVRTSTRLGPDELRRALNGVLPQDVAVVAAESVPEDFHARRDASGKLYRYAVWNGPSRSPLRRRSHWAIRDPLDLAAMRRAALGLVGTHDFAAFRGSGSAVKTTVRTLTRLDVRGEAGGEVLFEVEGTGFLRHMVRAIVGTLVEVGRGRRPAGDVGAVLASGARARAGATAPAQGLRLVRVDYGKPRESESLEDPAG